MKRAITTTTTLRALAALCALAFASEAAAQGAPTTGTTTTNATTTSAGTGTASTTATTSATTPPDGAATTTATTGTEPSAATTTSTTTTTTTTTDATAPPPSAEIAPAPSNPGGLLVLGAEVGALVPFTSLGAHVNVGLEVGVRLPFIGRRLEIMGAVGYAPPQRRFTVDGGYMAEAVQQELFFSIGPRFRVMDGASPWNVTIAAGLRVLLLQSLSSGSRNGQPFGEYVEHSTQPGFFATVGFEYRLGPGAIFVDLEFQYSTLPHRITGQVSTAAFAPTVGYRFLLF